MPSSNHLSRIFDYREIILKEIVEAKPGLICISCVSDYFPWAIKIAQDIKAILNVPIVFGGPHPTAVPEHVLKHQSVDFVISGEGEEAILELVNCLENKKESNNIRNLCYRANGKVLKNPLRPLISDLDSLPFPDKELYYNNRNRFVDFIGSDNYTIMGSRGCPYSCSYCHNSYLRHLYGDSKQLRFRSPDNIIEELSLARKKYNFKRVAFCDDAFIYHNNKEWLREFLERYKKEIGMPFYCSAHPSNIDKETVDLLVANGCKTIHLGIQNLNENIRKDVLLRYGSNEDIIKAIKLISRTKMFLWVDIIVGLPRETEADLLDIASFFNTYRVDSIGVLWLRHYPKSEITKYLDKETVAKINDGMVYAPVTTVGTTFDRNKITLANLIVLANFIHSSSFRFIIRKKLYQFLPRINLHYINLIFSIIVAKISTPGKYTYPRLHTVFDQLRYHEYYISKYLREKLKR
jgi:radical SAM superfamily enzyme YgiQ (UPF0313 family)